jgi:hypothetical protein
MGSRHSKFLEDSLEDKRGGFAGIVVGAEGDKQHRAEGEEQFFARDGVRLGRFGLVRTRGRSWSFVV